MANFYTDNKNMKFHLDHPLMEKIVRLKERNYADARQHDYAPVDFEDAMENYDKVLEVIGEICGEIVAPNAEAVDKDGPVLLNNEVVYAAGTQQNHEVLTKAGMIGMSLPRKYKGLNFPIVPYVMAAELVSRADAGFANIWGLQDCAETIHEFASDELKDEYLPRFNAGATAAMDLTEPDAGSDLQAVQLKATYDEASDTWYLNGVKRFITNGDADISLVLARSEPDTTDARGLSLFVYDRAHQAMTIRRIENKLGIKGSPTCELVFRNAPAKLIGSRRMGLIKYVMSLMNSARLGVGAQSVGIAEAAYREAVKYAREREQFGKAIEQYPAVYEMLTNMRSRIDAIRSLLYETSRHVDIAKNYQHIAVERKLDHDERHEYKEYQKSADMLTPILKLFSSEYCNQIASDSLQIHGGTGYMKDFPIERIYRDARITNIYEGTSQLQVVAAIRGIGDGSYQRMIEHYDQQKSSSRYEYLRHGLRKMKEQLDRTIEKVQEFHDDELWNFHARRLVEMAGNIIIGYLLLHDAERDEHYESSADIFIRLARAENIQKVSFINSFQLKDLGDYKTRINV
jgi:3-(methylthio)propanoyl-CoA dehydrogenase